MPKTIVIIGDSWGVPNYSKDWPNLSHLDHTEFQLKDKGYNVLNFSLNGGSNIETIEYARHVLLHKPMPEQVKSGIDRKRDLYNLTGGDIKFMPEPEYHGQKIDWIVWFHTESIRDLNSGPAINFCTLKELYTISLHAGYRAFKLLIDNFPNVKTAVIGGQAFVDPIFYSYHTPNFIIEDWRSEIVGRKLPEVYSLSRVDLVDSLYDNTEEKLNTLNNHAAIYDAMSNTQLFFDRCHPGKPHIDLANRLHEEFSK